MTGDHGYEDDDLFEEDFFVVEGLDEGAGSGAEEQELPRHLRPAHGAPGGDADGGDEQEFAAELAEAEDEAELFGDLPAGDGDAEPTAEQQELADPWSSAAQTTRHAQGAPDADDVLFAAPIAGSEFDTELPSFQEHAESSWGGAQLTPEQMGLPVEGQELPASLDAVQEVDIDFDPNDVAFVDEEPQEDEFAGGDTEYAQAAAAGGGSLLHDGSGGTPEEGWEDIDITQLDAGTEQAEQAEGMAPAGDYDDPEPELEAEGDYAEAYADADTGGGTLHEMPRRRSRLRWVAGVAAMLIAGAGGAYWYSPEMFEPVRQQISQWLPFLEQQPEQTEVVQIDRPRQDPIELAPLVPDPIETPTDTDPQPPRDPRDPLVDPITRPVVELDPTPPVARTREELAREAGRKLRALLGTHLPESGDVRPLPPTDPGDLGAQYPPVDVAAVDPAEQAQGTQALLPVGDDVMFSKLPDQGPKSPQVPAIAQGIVTGTQALAQLHNGNFFIGRVKIVESTFVTLHLEKGEVTLAYDDLELLTIVGTAEYERLKMAEKAYVRLSNNNTLSGRLLGGAADGEVILEMRSSRVVIPIKAIEEIGKESVAGYRVTDDSADVWIQQQAENRLSEIRSPQPVIDPSTPPKPDGN